MTNILVLPGWPFVGGFAAFICAVMLSLVLMFVLDDFSDWLRHRHAKWHMTASALIYENPDLDMEAHQLSLKDVATVKPRLWSHVVLKLTSGQAITMRYIDRPKDAQRLILRTKEAMA